MFFAFYNKYEHGKDRDNYDYQSLEETGCLTADTREQLYKKMFELNDYQEKRNDSWNTYSVEWNAVMEMEVVNTIYQNWEFFDQSFDGDTVSTTELEEIINSTPDVKEILQKREDEKERKVKEKKRSDTAKKREATKRKERNERELYDQLKSKYEGEGL